jgi:hypothetical protein
MSAARALAAALLLVAAPGVAMAGEGAICLGPDVGQVLEGLVRAHAFAEPVPGGYRLERLDVKPDHVELGYDDDDGPAVTVVLVAKGAEGADGQGLRFDYRLLDARAGDAGDAAAGAPALPAPARAAMLRAAAIVDRAIPAEAVQRCDGPGGGPHPLERRAPAAFGLGAGLLEGLIVLAALALGLAWPRRAKRA